ncbi:MAG TPA: chemotaxis protein CheB [Bdellovibrionota bacterium]|nr:chemotaxis protein CheB [Bdellovibrionota bacterium]
MKKEDFPIVGIGASAGGLEALQELISAIPKGTHMAFVVIQHFDPTHARATAEILARATKMPVSAIKNNLRVEPRHVYVIQPNTVVTLSSGVLKSSVRPKLHPEPPDAIDIFFKSLADDQKERAIGIILSGTGSDGTSGIRAIKGTGGIAIAQEPKSAASAGMPQSAVSSGVIDIVAPPRDIAHELARMSSRLQTRDLFFETLSHELRTPLNSILLWAQMIRRGMANPEQVKRAAEMIEQSAKAQEKLIDDLLDVSRIMSGKLSLEKVDVELRTVVQKALESIRPATKLRFKYPAQG